MQKLLIIAILGAAGTLGRYLLSGVVQRSSGSAFPWGTLTVNCLGCLLFGMLLTLAHDRFTLSGEIRAVVAVGFLGAFTTFSTFAFETGQLGRDSEWLFLAGNLIMNNVLGVGAIFAGVAIARVL